VLRNESKCGTKLVLFVMTFCVMVAHSAFSQTYDTSQPPGGNFDQAQFRLWVPEGLQSIRAVLVLVPGSNGDGRDQVETPLWQNLAREQGLALVALHMTDKMHEDMFIEHYVDVSHGSGTALLAALEKLAQMSGHAEIATAPLLLWGMSAGGEFNYEFALWRPDRVAGFVVNKGGIYYSALASSEARKVPGLFFVGTDDLAFRNDIVRGIFSINRRAHALWALIEQTGVAHEVAGSDVIAAEFYREILNLRLTAEGSLSDLNPDNGYFCHPVSRNCTPAVETDAPREPVSWLATRALTETWKDAYSADAGSE
jgi:poly(3-hydroxybutyrate) depolymerase